MVVRFDHKAYTQTVLASNNNAHTQTGCETAERCVMSTCEIHMLSQPNMLCDECMFESKQTPRERGDTQICERKILAKFAQKSQLQLHFLEFFLQFSTYNKIQLLTKRSAMSLSRRLCRRLEKQTHKLTRTLFVISANASCKSVHMLCRICSTFPFAGMTVVAYVQRMRHPSETHKRRMRVN